MARIFVKRLFHWSPSTDTGIALASELALVILAYLGLRLPDRIWLYPLLFGLIGTVGVCVIFPLYWMVMVRKKELSHLGIASRHWSASLLLSASLGALALFGYYQQFGISAAILPALILGVYALWEIIFLCGWLQLRFEEAFGIIPGIILTALCFVPYHLGYGWYGFNGLGGLFLTGLTIAVIFRLTTNILILWPLFWPMGCLRGFKMGAYNPGWGEAVFYLVLLGLMLGAVFFFYRYREGYRLAQKIYCAGEVTFRTHRKPT